jgi:putative membrane protein
MWYMHGIGWGWWLVMSVGMVGFWALVVWAIVALVRGSASGDGSRVDEPLEVLQRRLARGQISPEDYEQRCDALLGRRERTPA